MRSIVSLVLVVTASVGCAAREGPDPAPHPEVTATDAPVRLVREPDADLVLFVSNQSFDDDKVRLSVTIDDVTVVEGDFYVEDQHNWVAFPLSMSAGGHVITATSDSGATLTKSFDTRRGKTRYAVIDHWTENDSAELTWRFQRQPIGFA